jgi:hypothetical protein
MASSAASEAPDGPLPMMPIFLMFVLMVNGNWIYSCDQREINCFFPFGKPIQT